MKWNLICHFAAISLLSNLSLCRHTFVCIHPTEEHSVKRVSMQMCGIKKRTDRMIAEISIKLWNRVLKKNYFTLKMLHWFLNFISIQTHTGGAVSSEKFINLQVFCSNVRLNEYWIKFSVANVCLLPHFFTYFFSRMSLSLSRFIHLLVHILQALKWKKTIFLRDLWIFFHCYYDDCIMIPKICVRRWRNIWRHSHSLTHADNIAMKFIILPPSAITTADINATKILFLFL